MQTTVTVYDETTAGQRGGAMQLVMPSENMTVRELIRERVFQEVKDHNADMAHKPVFRGLVQPTDAEETLNGYRLERPRMIDWAPQFECALEAFERNRVLIVVGDRQVESLAERVELGSATEVLFIKLLPLVGG